MIQIELGIWVQKKSQLLLKQFINSSMKNKHGRQVHISMSFHFSLFILFQIIKGVKKFVKVLFESLDTNKDGKLSFQEFEKALLLEPKLARCFVPQTLLDNSRDGSPKRVRSEMGATPSTTIESVNTQSVINLIPMLVEKEKVKKSREELLAAITNTASTSSVTQSHAVLGTDSQSTGCFCIVQ